MSRNRRVEATEPAPEPVPSVVEFREIAREARKEQLGADYFLSELEGEEITILEVDMQSSLAKAIVHDRVVKVTWRGAVATKKMAMIDRWIRTHNQAVKVRVLRRTSKSGRTYVDLL